MAARARFLKAQRLLARPAFDAVQDGSSTIKAGSRHFLLLVAPRSEPGPARLGVIASRRVGSSVRRNRAKRLVREYFRHAAAGLPPGIDVIVVVKPGAHELSAAQAAVELASALKRAKP